MFVGGCAGSTGGSIKNIRILVLLKLIKRETYKVFHPRAVISIKVNNRVLPSDVVSSISIFLGLYVLIFVFGTILISLEGLDLVSSSSAVAATLGNIGPGFGFVGPTHTYSEFSNWSKMLLSFYYLLLAKLQRVFFIIYAISFSASRLKFKNTPEPLPEPIVDCKNDLKSSEFTETVE